MDLMSTSLQSKKIDEALKLTLEARDLLIFYIHSKNNSVASIARIQEILRSILQCTALIQAYDQTPYRSRIYGHVSRTFHSVLDLQIDENSSDTSPHGEATSLRDSNMEEMTVVNSCASNSATSDGDAFPSHLHISHNNTGHTDSHNNSLAPTTVGVSTPSVCWSDIVGCEEAIRALRQATTLPLQFPQLFHPPRRPPRRILLYGPPGTGKTLLAAATACEYTAPLLPVTSADVLSKWIGESESQLRRLFTLASQLPRCVMFFDEIDALCGIRGASNESEASRRVKTELLLRLQGLQNDNNNNITIIAATNMPWELDSAFRRRFDHLIFVNLPSPAARRKLLEAGVKDIAHNLEEEDFEWIVHHTEGYSASDIQQIIMHAVMAPVNKITQTKYVKLETLILEKEEEEIQKKRKTKSNSSSTRYIPCLEEEENALPLFSIPPLELQVPEVCRSDFEAALLQFPPTVSTEEMTKFSEWRKREK